MNSALTVKNVDKAFGTKVVLRDLSFEAKEGEFIVLVGPSGCGKSTMLRAIAGLESINKGSIYIEDRDVTELPPKDRDIAMVFQDYALYPHKNVYENIAFGLRLRRFPEKEIDTRVREVAAKLDLSDLLERKPLQLSGGQRQRVAIGRAIVRKPKVFLFDEPLSNLDAKLRGSMRLTIARLQKELATTAVYVTHDQTEAMTLADRIIVLNDGIIQQVGSPLELYYRPANVFVGAFIGSPEMNLIEGTIEKKGSEIIFKSDGKLVLPIRPDLAAKIKDTVKPGQKVIWGLRPENLRVPKPDANKEPVFTTSLKVIVSEPLGPSTLALCDFDGHEVRISLPEPHRPQRDDVVTLEWRSRHLYLFDKDTGQTLVQY